MSILIASSRICDRQVEYRVVTSNGYTITVERHTATQDGFRRLTTHGSLQKFNTAR